MFESREDQIDAEIEAMLSPEVKAEYDAYLAQLEADEQRALERRGKPRPKNWGDPMVEDAKSGYFCAPDWDRGDPTGFHPHDVPPCDPPGWGV